MNIDTLRKAMLYQHPERFGREIVLGYEEAWEQVVTRDENGNVKSITRSKGFPDNDPDHAKIVIWPDDLPMPTAQDIVTWAAAYDAEQPAKESARQAKAQRRQAAKNAVKNFNRDNVKNLQDTVTLLEHIVELLRDE